MLWSGLAVLIEVFKKAFASFCEAFVLFLVALIRVYQKCVSPFLPPMCRFVPSCSEYAAQALQSHGLPGAWLALRRLLRCHPWHPGGFDPVPTRKWGKRALALAFLCVATAGSIDAFGETAPPIKSEIGEEAWALESPGFFSAQISSYHGAIRSFLLLKEQFAHRRAQTPKHHPAPPSYKWAEGPKDMVSTWDAPLYPYSFHFEALSGAPKVKRRLKSDPMHPEVEGDFWSVYARDPVYTLVHRDEKSLILVWPDPDNDQSTFFIERKWSLPDSGESSRYVLQSVVRLLNFGPEEISGKVRLLMYGWEDPAHGTGGTCGGLFAAPPDLMSAVCGVAGSVNSKKRSELVLSEQGLGVGADFAGLNSRYFLVAAIPETNAQTQCLGAGDSNGVIAAALQWDRFVLKPGVSACIPQWLVGKPGFEERVACAEARKILGLEEHWDVEALAAASGRKLKEATSEDEKANIARARDALLPGRMRDFQFVAFLGPKDIDDLKALGHGLEKTIDFWVLGFLCKPMLWIMRQSYALIPSWGVAIIVLTLLVKILTLWPTHKSMQQMRRLSELKPKIDKLRERYKDDKVKLNQELMELYKREKVNPLGGCLPMLLQMPIWVALYRTIYAAVDLYQAPLFLWIDDLSAPDPYFVMPLMLGALMFVQQKMTPTVGDQTQAKVMLWVMPLMFTAFMLFLPSGLVFYILVNTVLSIGQQWYFKRPQVAKAH